MKLTKLVKTLAAVCAVAITQLGHEAQAKENIPGVAEQPASYFYTGKPYDSDLGAYVFNYRNYNPELNRWISVDPSGFPDGANNSRYAAVPTSQYDFLGLKTYSYNYSVYVYFSPTSSSAPSLSTTISLAAEIAEISTTGMTSVVLTAIGTGVGLIPDAPESWTMRRTSLEAGWSDEEPPAGGTYTNFSVTDPVVSIQSGLGVYFPTDNTSGNDFFSPWQDAELGPIMANNQVPHPDLWTERAPTGMAYPGTQGSYSATMTMVSFSTTIKLDIE